MCGTAVLTAWFAGKFSVRVGDPTHDLRYATAFRFNTKIVREIES